MNIIDQARAAGFTHYISMAGAREIELFPFRDALGWTFEDATDGQPAAFFSPWRPADAVEIGIWESRGNPPMIGLQARDRFTLQRIA